MIDQTRIDGLRRRVQMDPTSIAFAQLAEELRRADQLEEAIATARAGLAVHPSYVSARVTLGRALLALGRLDEAEAEFATVLDSAPSNLSALKGLGEICQRRGRLLDALARFQAALNIARNDPDLQEAVDRLTRQVGPLPAAIASNRSDCVHASEPAAGAIRSSRVREQRTIEALEQWLDAIHVARAHSQP
jgi:tetratricopeptide (TPR) repeat protein